ncbi:hypothetical protein BH11ARM2_BH11ARM2_26380 [soil metagenome]
MKAGPLRPLILLTTAVVAQGWSEATAAPWAPLSKGAKIDEGSIRRVVRVSPAKGPIRTLQAGFRKALESLRNGVPTRIEIEPGIYRQAVTDLDWRAGRASETPLVVQGTGKVVWTGADVFPLREWKKEKGLWTHPWPYRWGNFAYSWSAKGLIGHRSEMAFVNGRPLMPRILERYAVEGIVQDPAKPGQVSYRYLGCRDPQTVLKPGEFGVIERPENGPSLSFRPLPNETMRAGSIEVSTRRNLLDLRGKSRVVLRNITFVGAANDDGDYGADNAIRFSIEKGRRSHDVLIDRCKVLWSAQTGLHIDGDHWTIRDSEFSFNGGSGIASGKSSDILWERNQTDFNVWRLWRAGELGYYTGGFKMHETTGHTIRDHESIGNCTMGAWWDVHCRDVDVKDLVAIGNAANLQFELCEGPFVADRLLLARGRAGDGQLRLWEHGSTALRNSILYSDYRGSGTTGLYNLRWFGRTDAHAKMAKLTAGTNVAEGNVFVAGANVPNFGMIDDIRGAEWSAREPLVYRGKDNVFWQPTEANFQDRWIKDDGRSGELAARAIPVADWRVPATYSEVEARRFDPRLRDPEHDDYRFAPDSPLYGVRNRYPQFRLGAERRKEWRWFIGWSGYQPDVWNEPPPE